MRAEVLDAPLRFANSSPPASYSGQKLLKDTGTGGILVKADEPVSVLAGDLLFDPGTDWYWGIVALSPGRYSISFKQESGEWFAVELEAVEDSVRVYDISTDSGTGSFRESWPLIESCLAFRSQPPRLRHTLARKPKIKDWVPPEYPASARDAGIEGLVWVNVLVDEHGNAEQTEISDSPSDLLSEVSMRAAAQCEFIPASIMGYPLAVWVTLPYNFRLY